MPSSIGEKKKIVRIKTLEEPVGTDHKRARNERVGRNNTAVQTWTGEEKRIFSRKQPGEADKKLKSKKFLS